MSEHDEPEGYDGEVTLRVDGEEERTAHAALVSRFDPLAGRVIWTGRVAAEFRPGTRVEIGTPYGSGAARATERDVWGNTRVTGVGRPPFPVELLGSTGLPD
jgi:uncharacterized protein DUF4873